MKNNKLFSLILALLVCFTLVVTVSATTDSQNLKIAVEANPSTVVYGNTITVSVMIDENPGNLGVNFDVKWDTDVLECSTEYVVGDSFTPVKVVSKNNRVVITVGNPSAGIQEELRPYAPKIVGTGKIVELTFNVKEGADADAVTSIYIDRASYVDMNGKSVESIGLDNLDVHVVATNHQHTPGAAATCTTNQTCTHCFAELEKALGHKEGAAATCTTNQICERCNIELAPAQGHKEGAAATCTTAQTCTVCNAELKAALGHKEGAAATCTTAQTCTVCNAELVKALGHKEGAAATCTTAQTCTVCNAELKAALGHKAQNLPSKAATCTETGLTQGSKCETCGVTLKAQETVAALGHNWNSAWVNSSSSGHYKTCKTCGEKKDNAAHTMSDGVCSVCGYGCKHTGGTATCSEQAVCTSCNKPYGELLVHTLSAEATCATAQTCTVCNAVIVEKLDHELEFVNAQAATCGAIGWEQYEKCKNCDHTTYKEIAATGNHTFGEWTVETEATTKAPGKQTHTCTVCSFVESEEIPVLEAPEIPWLLIIVLVVLVAAVVVVIVLIKKKKN